MHFPEQEAAQPPTIEEAQAAFRRLAEQADE